MKKIMAFVLVACAIPSQAAEWYYLNTSGREASHYLDASSVVRTSDSVDAWIKSVQLFRPSSSTHAWSMTVRWRINCVNRTSQTMEAVWHDERGRVLHMTDAAGVASSLLPDSAADVWRTILCDRRFPMQATDLYLKVPGNNLEAFQNIARSIYLEAK